MASMHVFRAPLRRLMPGISMAMLGSVPPRLPPCLPLSFPSNFSRNVHHDALNLSAPTCDQGAVNHSVEKAGKLQAIEMMCSGAVQCGERGVRRRDDAVRRGGAPRGAGGEGCGGEDDAGARRDLARRKNGKKEDAREVKIS
mmetsp:Transcript_16611/g.42828  ORF Transcript_16611/g.42828 Transcript_16611/m.42828 type:complete len:142 (+) Transcript_16611:372-797(+)